MKSNFWVQVGSVNSLIIKYRFFKAILTSDAVLNKLTVQIVEHKRTPNLSIRGFVILLRYLISYITISYLTSLRTSLYYFVILLRYLTSLYYFVILLRYLISYITISYITP